MKCMNTLPVLHWGLKIIMCFPVEPNASAPLKFLHSRIGRYLMQDVTLQSIFAALDRNKNEKQH